MKEAMHISHYYEFKIGDIVFYGQYKTRFIVVNRSGYRRQFSPMYRLRSLTSPHTKWAFNYDLVKDDSFEAFVLKVRWEHKQKQNRRRLKSKKK